MGHVRPFKEQAALEAGGGHDPGSLFLWNDPRPPLLSLLQEELVNAAVFRYITDAITKEEALEMLRSRAATKADREQRVRETGYPAYVTSAGWLGYDDEKVTRLTKEALAAGFNHFKASHHHHPLLLLTQSTVNHISTTTPDESRHEPRIGPPTR